MFLDNNLSNLAAGLGFEPRLTGSRPAVLPLDDPAKTDKRGAAFIKKFGLILNKAPDRSGGAGRKGSWGERNSRPALAFATAEFRASETGAPPQFFTLLFYLFYLNIAIKHFTFIVAPFAKL